MKNRLLLSKKKSIEIYISMQRIRLVEENIAKNYKNGLMRCPVHLSIGQEAVATGVCNLLTKEDLVLSAHRSHAHYLAKGGSLKAMLSEIHGKKNGCAGGKGGSMHLIDHSKGFIAAVPIVGSTIPMAVGASWGLNLQNKKNLVCVFFGDGATEEGVFQESLNFASLHNLQTLFICENNLYSVYTNINKRRNRKFSLKKFVESHGINYLNGDGNNVQNVIDLTTKAIRKMKKSKSSALIEFNTYRWLEHCGPEWDDHLNYRKKNELNHWVKRDPIKNFRNILINKKILNNNDIEKINKKIQKEIDLSFHHAIKSEFPKFSDLNKNIFSS